MTLDTPPAAPCTPVSPRSPGELRDSGDTVVHRERPIVHPAVDPPLCEDCLKAEMSFFDPNCPGCIDLLSNETTTSPEIFAILRQWTPQTQQNLEILIREVLKRGANVNDHDGQTDMTLLMYVAKAGAHGVGDVDEACRMATLLLSRGADVFTRCRWTNMTPSHYATYFDVAPVLKILLKASRAIDVDSLCSEFDHGSPLHIAAANLAYESGKVLLNNGANPHIKDDLGRLPIDCVPDPAEFEVNSDMAKLCAKVRRMFMEASEEHQANEKPGGASQQVLAALGINVGEKVMVGGVKSGILRFCGPTEFASGMWAGIELDEAAGKNDGSVGSISYFKCPPKYGIFAPISKISKAGILVSGGRQTSSPGGTSSRSSLNFPKVNTSHVTSRIDTGLSRLGGGRGSSSHPDELMEVGERVIVAGQRRGVVKYSGEADFAPGWWYGVELDRPVGKNDGSVNGKRFFTCKPKFGVFAPPSRVQRIPSHGDSRDSLDSLSATATDRQRRLSGSAGSQQSLNSSSSKKAATRTPSKNLRTIAEKTTNNRPKSSGTLAMWRTPPAVAAGGEMKLQEGMSVFCNNELGVLRYIGEVDFAEGLWLGVELRTPKGKNDGSVQGRRYFMCRPLHGLLVRPSKVTIRGINGAKLLGESAEADGSK